MLVFNSEHSAGAKLFYYEQSSDSLMESEIHRVWKTPSGMDTLDAALIALGAEIDFEEDAKDDREITFRAREALVWLRLRSDASGYVAETRVAARLRARRDEVFSDIRNLFPEEAPPSEEEIEVGFWALGANGPINYSRRLEAPRWEAIKSNYPPSTRLSYLMEGFTPNPSKGQLILWHGRPGTGKTFALRALVQKWREWCGTHYVIDPEEFFGNRAAYMVQVMLEGHQESRWEYDGDRHVEIRAKDWRLMIFEDTGELLSQDAKKETGQGLSRLLNLVDGLIGQGLKIMCLITTNEDIERMHEAVVRPGRCLSEIRFESFNRHEARDWLDAHRPDVQANLDSNSSYTLAELYALGNERVTTQKPKATVGFSAS